MTSTAFAGDRKVGQSILSAPEKALVSWGTPKIPAWLETYHLTLLTVLWSGLNALFGFLAKDNIHWLWLVSLMIVLQYFTDLFDGAVGRARGTGLVKWGFYMDHFLDYIFLSSLVLAGYFIAPAGLGAYYLILLILTGGFMVNTFLGFAATNQFEIYFYGFGPTEMRIVFILINTVIILTGTEHFRFSVPLLCFFCFAGLIIMVKRTSNKLWSIDMANKENKT
jgi:phosphatidylglycerophosphate synthase